MGPIIVLSYKNHALDEFLLDLLKNQGQGGNMNGRNRKWLIRSGKAESDELSVFLEKTTTEERNAQDDLKKEITKLRSLKRLFKEWMQVANGINYKVII